MEYLTNYHITQILTYIAQILIVTIYATVFVLGLETIFVSTKQWRYLAFFIIIGETIIILKLSYIFNLRFKELLSEKYSILELFLLVSIWANTRVFPFTRKEVHQAIIRGEYYYPYQHRILVPTIAEWLYRCGLPLYYGYLVLRVVPFWMGIKAMNRFFIDILKLSEVYTFLGDLIMISYLSIIYYDYWIHNTDALNFWIFAEAITHLISGNWLLLSFLVFIGTLNRETTLLIVLTYLPFSFMGYKAWTVIPLFLAWIIPYFFLRWKFRKNSSGEFWVKPSQCVPYNLKEPRCWIATGIMLVPWITLTGIGFNLLLQEYSKIILLGMFLTIPWGLIHFLVAKLDEPRLALPLLPVWVGLSLKVLESMN